MENHIKIIFGSTNKQLKFNNMEGAKRKQSDRKLFVGWAESKIIAVNPTKDEFEKMGIELEEEPVYSKDKDGEEVTWIDFWEEEIKTGYKYKRTFFLQDVPAKSKPKEGQTDFVEKTQYVNQVGDSTWVENKKELKEGFTKFRKKDKKNEGEYEIYGDKISRIAKRGEGDLMAFVKMWMAGMDYYDVDTNILLDMKKIFNGNFKELKEQINGQFTLIERNGKEYPTTVVDVLEVKTVSGEEGTKEYQAVHRRAVPGWHMKAIRNTKFSKENIAKWAKEGKSKSNPSGTRWLKDYEKVAVEMSLGDYKSKNFYSLEPMHEYNPDENFVASGQAVTTGKENVTVDEDDY